MSLPQVQLVLVHVFPLGWEREEEMNGRQKEEGEESVNGEGKVGEKWIVIEKREKGNESEENMIPHRCSHLLVPFLVLELPSLLVVLVVGQQERQVERYLPPLPSLVPGLVLDIGLVLVLAVLALLALVQGKLDVHCTVARPDLGVRPRDVDVVLVHHALPVLKHAPLVQWTEVENAVVVLESDHVLLSHLVEVLALAVHSPHVRHPVVGV